MWGVTSVAVCNFSNFTIYTRIILTRSNAGRYINIDRYIGRSGMPYFVSFLCLSLVFSSSFPVTFWVVVSNSANVFSTRVKYLPGFYDTSLLHDLNKSNWIQNNHWSNYFVCLSTSLIEWIVERSTFARLWFLNKQSKGVGSKGVYWLLKLWKSEIFFKSSTIKCYKRDAKHLLTNNALFSSHYKDRVVYHSCTLAEGLFLNRRRTERSYEWKSFYADDKWDEETRETRRRFLLLIFYTNTTTKQNLAICFWVILSKHTRKSEFICAFKRRVSSPRVCSKETERFL